MIVNNYKNRTIKIKYDYGSRKMLCEYKGRIMYISVKTLELFYEYYPDEFKKIKWLSVNPKYVTFNELVELIEKEEIN